MIGRSRACTRDRRDRRVSNGQDRWRRDNESRPLRRTGVGGQGVGRSLLLHGLSRRRTCVRACACARRVVASFQLHSPSVQLRDSKKVDVLHRGAQTSTVHQYDGRYNDGRRGTMAKRLVFLVRRRSDDVFVGSRRLSASTTTTTVTAARYRT